MSFINICYIYYLSKVFIVGNTPNTETISFHLLYIVIFIWFKHYMQFVLFPSFLKLFHTFLKLSIFLRGIFRKFFRTTPILNIQNLCNHYNSYYCENQKIWVLFFNLFINIVIYGLSCNLPITTNFEAF